MTATVKDVVIGMRKTVLISAVLLFSVWAARADVRIEQDVPLRLQSNYADGGVAIGGEHDSESPVYYVVYSGEYTDDEFWYFDEQDSAVYQIRNAMTGDLLYYDGVYEGTYRRYLNVSTEAKGDSSLWEVVSTSGGYQINCVLDVESNSLNLRTTSYVVGTYEPSASSNALWTFWNEDGTEYNPEDSTTSDSVRTDVEEDNDTASYEYGVDYGTSAGSGYWENTGLDTPIVVTTDESDPVLYTIMNVRSSLFLQRDESDNYLIQVEEDPTEFYFVQGTDGLNIYTSDGYYMSGYIKSTSTKAALAVEGTTSTGDNTWTIGYYTTTNPGYTIGVETCSENNTSSGGGFGGGGFGGGNSGNNVDADKVYWNDLSNTSICYYSIDGGSTFVFYSTDERHRSYLMEQGMDVPAMDSIPYEMTEACDTLWVNGRMAIYDAYFDVYLFPVPSEYAESGEAFDVPVDVSLSVVTDSSVIDLVIDGDTIAAGDNYAFSDPGYNVYHSVEVLRDSVSLCEGNLTFTFLPIVELNGSNFSSSYSAGEIRVTDPESLEPVDSLYNANVKWRGATALGYTKKAYAIKLKDTDGETSIDRKFLGMREDNNWILDAMAVDPARMRNRVAFDLWLDYSEAPYYAESEPKAVNGTNGKFVEVLLNGEYRGIYCLTEKIDRKQLKLKKIKMASDDSQSDTIRGVLYKSEGWSYSVFMGHESGSSVYPMTSPSSYNNSSMDWDEWEMKYPDLDDGESIDWGPLYDAICVPATYGDEDFVESVADWFDLPLWRDYYLFLDLLLATDNHGKNMFIYNYDVTKSNKTSLAPWDLDGVFGRRWDGSTHYTSDPTTDFTLYCEEYEHGEHTMYYRLRTLDYENWSDSLCERYAELRSDYFTADGLYERFADYWDSFRRSGADEREVERWDDVDGVSLDFEDEMDYIETWLSGRIDYMDSEYGYDPEVTAVSSVRSYVGVRGGRGCIYLNLDEAQTLRVYTLDGRLAKQVNAQAGLSVVEGLQSGIYIVAGKKVMVE